MTGTEYFVLYAVFAVVIALIAMLAIYSPAYKSIKSSGVDSGFVRNPKIAWVAVLSGFILLAPVLAVVMLSSELTNAAIVGTISGMVDE